jgi:RHS repeat-associated protein
MLHTKSQIGRALIAALALAAMGSVGFASDPQYYVNDPLATTVAITDSAGEIAAMEADAFGAPLAVGEAPGRFTGKPYDADLGAYVFPFRNYRPEEGRWMSADPSGFPDGMNGRVYLAFVFTELDPMGLRFVFNGQYADSYKKIVDGLRKNGSDQIKKLVGELDESKRDHRIDELKGNNADGTPATTPYTTPDMLDTGVGHDTTTYVNPSSYTLGNRTWTFPQALVHELLHARDQLNGNYDFSDPHTADFMRMENSFMVDVAKLTFE